MTTPIPYKHFLRDGILITAGIFAASVGLRGFLLPNHFLDGGATGVSLLLERVLGWEFSLVLLLVNLPFILMGRQQISTAFAVKSALAIVGLALLVHGIDLPVITQDKLLIAVFGGFFLGLGIGLSIRGGAVIDGTEVLAIAVSRRSSLSVGDFIAVFNALLFIVAAFLINIETAMYSMLTYIAASKTVDFILLGIEEYIGVTIISDHALEIKAHITHTMGFGVTMYNATSGYGRSGVVHKERKVLFCVLTRLEVTQLLNAVEVLDPKAFIIQTAVKETRGGMIKKRPLH